MAMKFRGIKGAPGKDHMTSHWSREVRKIIESHLPLKGDMWSLPGGYLYPVAIIQSCWPHEKIRHAVRLHPLKCWTKQFSMNNVAKNSSTVTRFSLLASYNIKVDTPFSLHLSVLFCFLPSSQYQQTWKTSPRHTQVQMAQGSYDVFSIFSNRWQIACLSHSVGARKDQNTDTTWPKLWF